MSGIEVTRRKKLVLEAIGSIGATVGTSDPRKDALDERKKATFDSDEMCYYINGGKENVERQRELIELMSKHQWADKSKRYSWTREEEYVNALRGAIGIWYVAMHL